MHFKNFLKNSAEEIDLAIENVFDEWIKEIERISPRLLPLGTQLKAASTGGKRIRGCLVLLGYQMYSQTEIKRELLRIAAAYEIFQTAILTHDDIIDKSPTRRGKPALHRRFGDDHYGISQAICLGDIGFFLAYKMIAESNFPDREKNTALAFFSRAMLDTGVGQMLDVALSQKNVDANDDDVLAVYRLKTAYYTFVGPLILGAVLGGASDISHVEDYGNNIGIAFQIQDDIRDVFGTLASLKKEIGGDIKEGKNTVLFLRAKEQADKQQLSVLDTYYGNPDTGEKEIAKIKKVFVETGALDYAKDLAQQFSLKAEKSIASITSDPQARQLLHEIISFVMR